MNGCPPGSHDSLGTRGQGSPSNKRELATTSLGLLWEMGQKSSVLSDCWNLGSMAGSRREFRLHGRHCTQAGFTSQNRKTILAAHNSTPHYGSTFLVHVSVLPCACVCPRTTPDGGRWRLAAVLLCVCLCGGGEYLWVSHALRKNGPWQEGWELSIVLYGILDVTLAALPPHTWPEMTSEPQLGHSGVAEAGTQHSCLSLQLSSPLSASRLSLLCRTPLFHPTRSGLSVTRPPSL